MDESRLLNERLSSIANFWKRNLDKLSWLVLAVIVWFSVYIRTRNTAGLRDVSTGGWTLGPDLDPFLFLRWTKEIVSNGSLYSIDPMRYVPLGFNTSYEFVFLSYLMAWFHKLASAFGSVSVEQSAALFPVFMFALTVIAFFLFVKKLFISKSGKMNATIIALISSLFLSIIPALLPRTIAGIPEKESVAFFFMFLAFYFALNAWSAEGRKARYVNTILAGLSTAGIGLIWGGVLYVLITLSITFLAAFILGQINKEKVLIFPIWLAVFLITVMPFSARYSLTNIVASFSTNIPLAVCLVILVHHILTETRLRDAVNRISFSRRMPSQVFSLLASVVLGIIAMIIFLGPSYVFGLVPRFLDSLIHPFTQNRFTITVAENRMPYFSEWAGSFGPYIFGIPATFWLFFIGSVYLFWNMVQVFEPKVRKYLTVSYLIFLFAIIFSRYRPDSILNGENLFSNLVYFAGMIVLVGTFTYWYFRYFKQSRLEELKNLDFGMLMVFSLFFLSTVSARGGVRLIMLLVPPASILIGYLIVQLAASTSGKTENWKRFTWVVFALVLVGSIFAAAQFSNASILTAQGFVPSSYTQQWQKAMDWVRENTPVNAVFGHWWDYGYWVQSIGERATVLDGGNSYGTWNYFMGRYALTGPNEKEALSYLYTHKATHFLIDSSDIGKYTAFSSIGSDENYDRYSWLNTFTKDNSRTVELKNSTRVLYTGGFVFDDDFIYKYANGTQIFIPMEQGGVAAIIIEESADGIKQPEAIAVNKGRQYQFPIRYAFYNGTFIDFESGAEAGVYIFPSFDQEASGGRMDQSGALIYLSNKTVKSQLARLYLYEDKTPTFKLVHTEDDFVVSQLKQMGVLKNDIVYFQGLRGPIKIWEINYPTGIVSNSTYLETSFTNSKLEEVNM